MKNAARVATLVGIIFMSWFATVRPGYAYLQDCSAKDGSACTNYGAESKCIITDESSQCYYIYPCYCDHYYNANNLTWRCGTSWIYEGCSFTTNTELGHDLTVPSRFGGQAGDPQFCPAEANSSGLGHSPK